MSFFKTLNSKKVFLLVEVLFFSSIVFSLVALAEEDPNFILPQDIKVSTPYYKHNPKTFTPKEGRYLYEVSWSGIPAAEVLVDVSKSGGTYRLATKVRTLSGIDLLYKLRYEAEGFLDLKTLRPIKSKFYYAENSNVKRAWLDFSKDGFIHAVRIRNNNKKEEYNFNPNNFTLDPFSAGFIARGLDWHKGQTRKFDTFNGKTRYLITFKAIDRVQMKVNGKNKFVWVISPNVKKLSEKKFEKQKLRQAFLYVTDDQEKELLQIKSEVFIGSVKTVLESFTPFKTNGKLMLASNQQSNFSFIE